MMATTKDEYKGLKNSFNTRFKPITSEAIIAPTNGSKAKVYLYVSLFISIFFTKTGIIEKYERAK
jgi:hypothetical protein